MEDWLVRDGKIKKKKNGFEADLNFWTEQFWRDTLNPEKNLMNDFFYDNDTYFLP